MATFDQLSADKRAVIELVLQQGRSYEELSTMLGMPEPRVRTLARDALVELAPVSAARVEEDWRGQLADYVLGQQGGPEATATKGHLRRSEAARTWARSLLDSLDSLYRNGSMPQVPEGERGARARASGRAPRASAETPGELSPEARTVVMRRRIAGAAALGALVLVALLLWPIGLLGGDDGDEGSQASTQQGSVSTQTRGRAIIARQGGRVSVLVTAVRLEPTPQGSGYQVWLYNSPRDRTSLGARGTDQQGNLQAAAPLPKDYRRYKFIDVTRVSVEGRNARTGRSVLRGIVQLSENPVTQGTGRNRVTLLADVRLVPLPS